MADIRRDSVVNGARVKTGAAGADPRKSPMARFPGLPGSKSMARIERSVEELERPIWFHDRCSERSWEQLCNRKEGSSSTSGSRIHFPNENIGILRGRESLLHVNVQQKRKARGRDEQAYAVLKGNSSW
jgi:hypothetical protein